MTTTQPVYVVDGARTPYLKARGVPGPFSAAELALQAGHSLLLRQPFEPDALDEVILGCIAPAADEANIARVVALRLGCGDRTPAWTVQRNCGSGMQALASAAERIAAGEAELTLAGGTESMSHAPILLDEPAVYWLGQLGRCRDPLSRLKQLARFRPAMLRPVIGLLRGLTDPVTGLSMGQTAERVAARFGIDREAMDAYAVRSHQRLAAAQAQGRLDEIAPLYERRAQVHLEDDGLRADSDIGKLARLKPVFERPYGLVTAGNSAQVSDGAAWCLLASAAAVRRHQLPVIGRIVDCRWAGLDPAEMGLGPVHAATPLLRAHRLSLGRIDYWEINEAFAAQVLGCLAAWRDPGYCKKQLGRSRALGEIDPERLNVDGGAIALGHPVGSSGARIVLHLLHVLQREQGRRGIAALCIGGGQGGAMLVERA